MKEIKPRKPFRFFIACLWIFICFRSDSQPHLSFNAHQQVQKEVSRFFALKTDSFPKTPTALLHSSETSIPYFSWQSFEKRLKSGNAGIFLTASSTYSKEPNNFFIDLADSPVIDPSIVIHPLLRNQNSSFWRKAGRGELLIGGVEIIGMGILMMLPNEMTKWEEDWQKVAKRHIKRTFTRPPIWDQDDFFFNYIGHPIAGSYYYNAVRSQNAKWWESLLFSTAQSCIWEYLIEGFAEQPSIQDLIFTPIGGLILGEPAHIMTMQMRRNGFNFIEKVCVLLLNPMFVINNGFGPKHNPVRMR